MNHSFAKPCAVVASTLLVTLAVAGGGHDHGETKPAASSPALPRLSAQTDLFEAVGVLLSDELSLFIDRTNSNEPVLDATVELESGGVKLTGKFHADHGDYSFDAKPFARAGEYPITLTIKAGADSDLLTGELIVQEPDNMASAASAHAHGWQRSSLWGGAALALALLAYAGIRRFIKSRRDNRTLYGIAA